MGSALKLNLGNKPIAPSAAFDMLLGGENTAAQITMLPIDRLTPYPNQPFKPYHPEKLRELADNIERHGILEPVVVRPYEGKYQILAGHNRTTAARLAGRTDVPCFVKDACDDDTAALIMSDSNLYQREELLPSEKAQAYKVQADALKNLGVHNVRTTAELADKSGDSKRNIQYYIRLTYLVRPLLDMVDNGQIPFRAGVNLSYVEPEGQNIIFSFMEEHHITAISLKQSEGIKSIMDMDEHALMEVFNLIPDKKAACGNVGANSKRVLKSYFSKSSYTDDEIANILAEALDRYFAVEEK